MTTFSYIPSYPATSPRAPAVRKTPFGDGYVQREEEGINSFTEVWELQFLNTEKATGDEIDAFFKARKGKDVFQWTTPLGLTANFVCDVWTYNLDRGNMVTITARFEQDFRPT